MKLLVDNCVSPRLARAAAVAVEPDGHVVKALRDKFDERIADIDWITEIGREGGWTVLSGDLRIRKVQAERIAWREARLIGFFLARGWRKMTVIEQTARVLLWWPRLLEAASLFAPGTMVDLPIGPRSRLRPLPF